MAFAELLLGRSSLGLDLSDPRGDDDRVGSGLERFPVAGESGVAVDKSLSGCRSVVIVDDGRFLGLGECATRLLQPVRLEDPGDPVIEGRDDLRLAHVHSPRVLGSPGERVLGGVSAAVVGLFVVPAPLHPAVAQPASKEATQEVGPRCPAGFSDRGAPIRGSPCSRGLEHLRVDQRLVGDAGGAYPGILVVPAQPGPVTRRHVLHVDQNLVAALATPDRDPRVPRVDQDRADGALAPAVAVPVGVASAVIGGGGEDPVAGEAVGDREQSLARDVLLEDPDDDGP